jgi:hypothetical protein
MQGVISMEAVRVRQVVAEDGEVLVRGIPYKKGQVVEIIVLPQPSEGKRSGIRTAPMRTTPRSHLTVRQLRQSGLIGMWKDRDDIRDSAVYARRLREQAQRRGDIDHDPAR